jgi:hypothetical protein
MSATAPDSFGALFRRKPTSLPHAAHTALAARTSITLAAFRTPVVRMDDLGLLR